MDRVLRLPVALRPPPAVTTLLHCAIVAGTTDTTPAYVPTVLVGGLPPVYTVGGFFFFCFLRYSHRGPHLPLLNDVTRVAVRTLVVVGGIRLPMLYTATATFRLHLLPTGAVC